eukprot:scaffold175051_cov27-Tisochrysis_lutea.AAC.5
MSTRTSSSCSRVRPATKSIAARMLLGFWTSIEIRAFTSTCSSSSYARTSSAASTTSPRVSRARVAMSAPGAPPTS